MLRVGDGVANDVLEEDLEHAARLLVNEVRDALHAATTREAAVAREKRARQATRFVGALFDDDHKTKTNDPRRNERTNKRTDEWRAS